MRHLLYRGVALVIPAVIAVGCSTSYHQTPLDTIRPYRTDGLSTRGEWELKDDVLFNLIPADATALDIAEGTNGVGVSLGLVENVAAHDVIVDVDVTFEPGSAVGPVVLAGERDGVVYTLYWLALNIDGVTLWRFHEQTWTAVARDQAPMNPAAPHSLRLEVRGPSMEAFVDGRRIMEGTHSGGAGLTRIGVMAREGIAGLQGMRYAILDKDE